MRGFSTVSTVVTIIVIALVAAGVWYYMNTSGSTPLQPTQTSENAATTTAASGSASSSGNAQAQAISAGGNSDASLNTDLTAIDTQMQSASNASGNVSQSFNDQPVPQAQ